MKMNLKNKFYILNIIVIFLILIGCVEYGSGGGSGGSNSSNNGIIGSGSGRVVDSSIPYGCDLSWVTQMEASGYSWKNSNGTTQDIFLICKNLGFNACRLRVWVNPSGGWNGQADTVAKALRAAAQGMNLMIDFHLSDTWADPSHQTPPAGWESYDVATMKTAIATHVTTVLTAVKTALDGAGYTSANLIKWIQIGNETNNGMLWTTTAASGNNCNYPAGYGTYPANYAAYFKAGYDAAKSVFPSALVGPHISNMYSTSLWNWNIGLLKNNGATWDICFGSLYPKWSSYPNLTNFSSLLTQVKATITSMNSSTYNSKPCLITEFGVDYTSGTAGYDAITSCLALTQTVPPTAVGLFYWEPECQGYNGYSLGAWDPSSKQPTLILTGN